MSLHMWCPRPASCPCHLDCPPLVTEPIVPTPGSLPGHLLSWLPYESCAWLSCLPWRPCQSPRWMNRAVGRTPAQDFCWHLGKLRPREKQIDKALKSQVPPSPLTPPPPRGVWAGSQAPTLGCYVQGLRKTRPACRTSI